MQKASPKRGKTGDVAVIRQRRNQRENPADARIKALFMDYDGTISPINVTLSKSAVPLKIMTRLCEISQLIPTAVITTKDLAFIVDRTPFAHAWAALGGLETCINGIVTRASCLKNRGEQISAALDFAKKLADNDLEIEEKQDSTGAPVGFSVDWRRTENKDAAKAKGIKIIAYCSTIALNVTKYEEQPFFDVFPCPVNKGKALLDLKRKFGLQGGILYMGDSGIDNAAFKKADIAVGILH
jgi:HAD superfamily hydrolase (TIGR01484 family)